MYQEEVQLLRKVLIDISEHDEIATGMFMKDNLHNLLIKYQQSQKNIADFKFKDEVNRMYEYTLFYKSSYILNTNWSVQLLIEYSRLLNRQKPLNILEEKDKLVFNIYQKANNYYCIIKMPYSSPISFGELYVERTKDYVKKIAAYNMLKRLWLRDYLNYQLKPKNDEVEYLDQNDYYYNFDSFPLFLKKN